LAFRTWATFRSALTLGVPGLLADGRSHLPQRRASLHRRGGASCRARHHRLPRCASSQRRLRHLGLIGHAIGIAVDLGEAVFTFLLGEGGELVLADLAIGIGVDLLEELAMRFGPPSPPGPGPPGLVRLPGRRSGLRSGSGKAECGRAGFHGRIVRSVVGDGGLELSTAEEVARRMETVGEEEGSPKGSVTSHARHFSRLPIALRHTHFALFSHTSCSMLSAASWRRSLFLIPFAHGSLSPP